MVFGNYDMRDVQNGHTNAEWVTKACVGQRGPSLANKGPWVFF